jgi:hypothetical protein
LAVTSIKIGSICETEIVAMPGWGCSKAQRVDSETKLVLARQLLVVLNQLIPRNDAGRWEILGKPWLVPTDHQLAQLTENELREDILAAEAEVNRRHAQLMSSPTVRQPM